jgi:hypothetical protein
VHVVRVEAPGFEPAEAHVVVREGARRELVSVTMRAEHPTTTVGPTPAGSEAASRVPLGSWLLGGSAIAALGTGIAFWLVGVHDRSGLIDRCRLAGTCTWSEISDGKRAATTELVIGDVGVGTGLIALGAAVWLGLPARSPTAPRARSIGVAGVARGAILSYVEPF